MVDNGIAILSHDYPSQESLNSYAFVHARVKLYQLFNKKVKVFVLGKKFQEYTFESVEVFRGNIEKCEKEIQEFKPDILCVHTPADKLSFLLIKRVQNKLGIPKIIWIHGFEALFYPKYYPIALEPYLFLGWVHLSLESFPQLKRMRHLFKDCDNRGDYVVFVSEWMKKEAERSVGCSVNNSLIVPNPVDTKLFSFKDRMKKWKNHTTRKAITVKNFSSAKYGVDVAIKAFAVINSNCTLHIYGKGKLAKPYRRLSKKLSSNSIVHEKYFSHNKLPYLYHQHDIFIAPSRTEAQGLAMCEFMATGGPIIATSVGGIPEFIRDGKEGILVEVNDHKGIAKAVDILMEDETLYKKMSLNCRKRSENILAEDVIIKKELSLMEKLINGQN